MKPINALSTLFRTQFQILLSSTILLLSLLQSTETKAQCFAEYFVGQPDRDIIKACDIPYLLRTQQLRFDFNVRTDVDGHEHIRIYDYVLPLDRGGLSFSLKGGAGGNSSINCVGYTIYGDGGKGGSVSGTVRMGNNPGQIPPGSTVRFVLGEAGKNSTSINSGSEFCRGGSGGGASAVLFRGPDDTAWTILAIAGGGGGGMAVCRGDLLAGASGFEFYRRHGSDGGRGTGSTPPGDGGGTAFVSSTNGTIFDQIEAGFDALLGNDNDLSWFDAQYDEGNAGGGGGVNAGGSMICACSGGHPGIEWMGNNIPLGAPADINSCNNYIDSRNGGRGFCGGGACYSSDNNPAAGGGGGSMGGEAGVREQAAQGGYSYANETYVTSPVFSTDNSIRNGFCEVTHTAQGGLVYSPIVNISLQNLAPICAGTPIAAIAKPGSVYGASTKGLINPQFSWSVNGQPIGSGTNLTEHPFVLSGYGIYNKINIIYNPGDVLTCTISANDTNICGSPVVTGLGTFTIPESNDADAGSQVEISSREGSNLCSWQRHPLTNEPLARATFDATAMINDVVYSNGNGGFFRHDPGATAQEIARAACESIYGVGGCTVGTSTYNCHKDTSTYASIITQQSQIWLNSPTVRWVLGTDNVMQLSYLYHGVTSYSTPPSPSSSVMLLDTIGCGTFSFYYKTGTSASAPIENAQQFVFAASGVSGVNQDHSNSPFSITVTDYFYYNDYDGYVASGPQPNGSSHSGAIGSNDLYLYDFLDSTRFGQSIANKLPFIRKWHGGAMTLRDTNIGNTRIPEPVGYRHSYRWYRNGGLLGENAATVDAQGNFHYYIIPDTGSSIIRYDLADGDSIWCEVTSNHCAIPSSSNGIKVSVAPPAHGGTISGPVHPCPNSNVTYTVSGAVNAVNYHWIITGGVTNLSGTGNTRSFDIGTNNVNIICIPEGPCGDGDTAHFLVYPSNHINGPCSAQPILINPTSYCQGQPVTLSVFGDSLNYGGEIVNANNYECYEWSTGENTQTITVTQNGSYYVYLNGCRSESVTISGITVPQPSIAISLSLHAIDDFQNYWCRQSGPRRIYVSSSSNLASFDSVQYRWYRNGQYLPFLSVFGPDNLDVFLSNPFFKSFDTIVCKALCFTSCGNVYTESNKIVLWEIKDQSFPAVSITAPPASCSGDTVTFLATPTDGGSSPTYFWILDNNENCSCNFVQGAPSNGRSFQFFNNTGSPQTHLVRVNMTSNAFCITGIPFAAQSTYFTVYPSTPVPTLAITSNVPAACPGGSVIYTAVATNGGAAPIYQWMKNGQPVGTNGPQFTDNTPDNSPVRCILTLSDPAPCQQITAESNVIIVPVATADVPTVAASPSTIASGETSNLNGVINGAVSTAVQTGFSGNFAPNFWTQNLGGPGSITTSGAPAQISIATLGESHFNTGPLDFTMVIPQNGLVEFDWAYYLQHFNTRDVPYINIDGVDIALPGIPYHFTFQSSNASGHFSASLREGQVLKLRMYSNEISFSDWYYNFFSGATGVFSNFSFTPQPGINWYDGQYAALPIGTSSSGVNFPVTPTGAGDHVYWAKQSVGGACGVRVPVTVSVSSFANVTGNTTGCDLVTLTATGGATYVWSGGSSLNSAQNSFSQSGSYTVTITAGDGATETITRQVTVHISPVAVIAGIPAQCGTVTLIATGGTAYQWSGGLVPASATNSFITSGNYTVTVSNASGCRSYASAAVSVSTLTTLRLVGATSACGRVVLTALGGNIFQWSGGDFPTSSVNQFTNSGTYTLAASNNSGCSVTTTAQVNVINAPNLILTGADTACNAVTLTASGGDIYHWSGGDSPNSATNTFNAGGVYSVTATNNADCSTTKFKVLTIKQSPTAGITPGAEGCGFATLTATGGISYHWSGGNSPNTATNTFNSDGNYLVTVTNAEGCDATASNNLAVPHLLVAGITGDSTACGSVTLLATGGTNYAWSGGNTPGNSSNTFTSSGRYWVTVTNATGCRDSASVLVTVNTAPVITCPVVPAQNSDLNLCSAIVNFASATATGSPSPAITYSLDPGTAFPVGSTTVTAAATNLCGAPTCNFNVVVNDNQLPVITCPSDVAVTADQTTCNKTLTIQLPVSGDNCGIASVRNNFNNTGNASGTYPVGNRQVLWTALDIHELTNTCTQNITIYPCIQISGVAGNATCVGTTTGSISTSVSGGHGSFSYLWSNGQTTAGLLNIVSGNYSVSVYDQSQGSATASFTVGTTIPAAKPATPGAITGIAVFCKNSTNTYSIAQVPYATAYNWTIPNGAAIQSGQGTTRITVIFQNAFSSGSIAVEAVNCLGRSAKSSLAVSLFTLPAKPTSISGAISVCIGTTQTYTAAAVAGATAYNWTVPANTRIISGQGTSAITLQYLAGFNRGNISANASNCIGNGDSKSIGINLLQVPAKPAPVTGSNSVCPGFIYQYLITSVPNATSYNWTVPVTATIMSGQGTTSITVKYLSSFNGGTVSVFASNCAGNGASQNKNISRSSNCGVAKSDEVETGSDDQSVITAERDNSFNVQVYPNPFTNQIHLQISGTSIETADVEMFDATGKLVMKARVIPGSADLKFDNSLSKGIYLLRIIQENNTRVIRLIKSK